MSVGPVERSILFFALYLLGVGLVLIFVPNLLLGLFGIPTDEPWIRLVGFLVLVLAYYYHRAVQADFQAFYMWTVHARAFILPFFVTLYLLDLAHPSVLLFGTFEAGCTLWTWLAIRARRRERAAA
jgi:hypothetical protein